MEATAERALATARVAAICDKIKEHRDGGKPMSARHVAVITAMIDDIAATDDAKEMLTTSKRKGRKGAARWSEELSRLDEAKFGVVVKSVRRDGCDAGDILREACFMAACSGHPLIVAYRGVTRTPAGTDDGGGDEYSLVADSAAGPRTLADVVREHGRPFPESDVRRIMRQLLGGAEAMAERGVVHRDIKPANVLYVSGAGAFKIAGFGTAKHAAERDPPELFAGTNGYTAPEVLLENAGHGTPVDAWSLGCVMLELLTGKLPFAGEDDDKADQLRKIFDVLGVPGRKAWQGLQPGVPAGEVQQRQARQRQVFVEQCNMLRELVPEKVLSEEGFEVLNGLLNCDPKKRLTAAAALQYPWFTDNALNDEDALFLSAGLAKITSAASQSWSLVLQMAMSFAGRTLQLLRPKGIAQVMIVM
ncbi:hypothetical protein EJB05_36958, partial [Eragrostis curvula]